MSSRQNTFHGKVKFVEQQASVLSLTVCSVALSIPIEHDLFM